MREQLHLMLDIETMSSANNAAVVAIGARLFTMKNGPGKGFEVFIDQGEAVKYGAVNPDTMTWWKKQPAYELVFSGKTQPADAFHRFIMFVQEHRPDVVWANSPQFDCVIMRHMAKQLGLEFPFHYRDERDFRTLRAIGKDLGENFDACWDGLTAHSPLDDATAQAKAMTMALRRVFSTPSADSGQGSAPAPVAPAPSAAAPGGRTRLSLPKSGRQGSSG